jgi:hypothetical protein
MKFPLLKSAVIEAAPNRPPGYLDAVLAVAEEIDGILWLTQEDYTALLSTYGQSGRPAGKGPGAHLKRLLHRLGIRPGPNCQCHKRAAEMDRRGADWCEEHIEEIVGWLAEEAAKAGLPFVPAIARFLVKQAIRKTRAEALHE